MGATRTIAISNKRAPQNSEINSDAICARYHSNYTSRREKRDREKGLVGEAPWEARGSERVGGCGVGVCGRERKQEG